MSAPAPPDGAAESHCLSTRASPARMPEKWTHLRLASATEAEQL